MFRQYKNEKSKTGINKEGAFQLTKEINSLMNGHDKKKDEIDMTPLQFEQVFKILDKDHSGYMEPCEILALV